MDIQLDNNDVKRFISNVKKDVYYNEKLKITTQNNNYYDELYKLLTNVPKDIINIIYEYTKEHYTIKYEISTQYDSMPIYLNLVYKKQIVINFHNIKNYKISYKVNMGLNYSYQLYPTQDSYPLYTDDEYSYDTDNGFKKVLYKDDADITLTNHNVGSSTWDDFITDNNLTYDENVPEEVITMFIFVVNEMLKIMINEGKSIIEKEYL